MSDLENPILTFPISQYSHCWKLQICIQWEKTREIAAKCWVKLMYTLYKVLSKTHVHPLQSKVRTWVLLSLCKVWTWLFVPQFRYYSSFQQCRMWFDWGAFSEHIYFVMSTVNKIIPVCIALVLLFVVMVMFSLGMTLIY